MDDEEFSDLFVKEKIKQYGVGPVYLYSKLSKHNIPDEQINNAITQLDTQTQNNANNAVATKAIAVATQDMATKIMQNADEKKFAGQDSITIEKFDISVSNNESKSTPTLRQTEIPKKVHEVVEPKKQSSIASQDDEWESF